MDRATIVMNGICSGFSVSRMIGKRQPIPSNMKKAKPTMLQYELSLMATKSGPVPPYSSIKSKAKYVVVRTPIMIMATAKMKHLEKRSMRLTQTKGE